MKSELQTKLDNLIEAMRETTDEERLEVIDILKGEFCDGCGRIGTGCQCQNDE